jgi:SPP1 gp7 family putative phage head morphogenesis protein
MPRKFRNAQADLVKAETAYANQLGPLATASIQATDALASIQATDALVIGRLGAIIGDPSKQIRLGWELELQRALDHAWARTWRKFTPRRLATEINTARNRVDRLNLGNLNRSIRRYGTSKAQRTEMTISVASTDVTGTGEQWDSRNADRAVGNAQGHMSRMLKVISAGVVAGKAIDAIRTEAQKGNGITRRGLANMAADETQTLNSDLSKERLEAAGVSRYKWITVGDDRVREEHAARNGQIFRWDTPPSDGHPGQPINCRCEAQPMIVSNRETARVTSGQLAEVMKRSRRSRGFAGRATANWKREEVPRLERFIHQSVEQVASR